MKMLLIAFNFDSEFGSEPYMAYSRAVAALKKYDLVHVITSDEANLETLKSLEKLNRNRFSYSILLRDRIPKFYGGAKFYVQYRRWQKKIPTHISQLEEKFDIAWHGSLTSPLLGTGLSLSSIPYIYGPLAFSIFPIRYVRIAGINALRELVRNLLVKIILCFDPFVRKSLKNAKVVIPGDENTRQLLVRHSSGNCHFGENVPCYAISNNSKIQVGSKSLDFVWVGKFISRKDPLFALEVARFIVQKRKESKFAFFGGGQLRKKLENRILGYNLADNVSIHSWVSKQEILNQISSANCLLFSSTRETTGNQLLEALNLGTPVIALDASGASSWLKSNRIIWKSPKISQSRINFAKEIADTYLTNILDAKSPNIEENFSSEQLLSHLLRDYG